MKTILLSTVSTFFVLTLLTSCAQKKLKGESQVLPDHVELLPLAGQNVRPTWISDTEILFHSSQRERHPNFQIYSYLLGDSDAKRITFHDGLTESAATLDGSLYYSSTTDEEKELSRLVERYQRDTPEELTALSPTLTLWPLEIYRSELDGSSISRLTHHQGFDGRLIINPDTRRILFSSLRNKRLQIFSMSLTGKALRQLTRSEGHSVNVIYAPDQRRYYWLEVPMESQEAQVLSADHRFKNIRALPLPQGRYSSLSYAPGQGLLLSANLQGLSEDLDLFFFRQKDSCLLSLLRAPGQQDSPQLSPQGTQLIFTHGQGEQSQIALMDFSPPEGPCLGAE